MLTTTNFQPSHNFGALDEERSRFETARFVVIPAPYEASAIEQSGARLGPQAILQASRHLDLFDIEQKREICEVGIHTTADVALDMRSPQHMAVRITEIVGEVLFAGKFPILLGGEHSLSFGAVAGILKLPIEEEITVLQLDARPNLHPIEHQAKWGRNSLGKRMSQHSGIKIVQAGLRSISAAEYSAVPAKVTQFWCEEMLEDFGSTITKVLAACSEHVYITFDVSICDPSWIGPNSAPEPGGLSYYQLRDLLRAVCTQKKVLGLDCVEFTGKTPTAAFALAKLLYKTMGYLSG